MNYQFSIGEQGFSETGITQLATFTVTFHKKKMELSMTNAPIR